MSEHVPFLLLSTMLAILLPRFTAIRAPDTQKQMSCQTGSIVSTYIYRDDDKPLYRRGNSVLLIFNLLSILVFVLTKLYYVLRNRQKAKVWNALTEEEQVHYRKTTKLQGSRRLDFQFAH